MRGFGGIRYGCAVFIGDSILMGYGTGSVTPPQAVPCLVSQTKKFSPWYNKGVGGDTSVGILARFEADCLAYGPSMIAIECGTNDRVSVPVGAIGTAGSYTDNVSKMIVKAQRTGARVTLWVPTLCQDATIDAAIAPYRTAMRGLASTYGCDLFDTYADTAALPGATQNSYFIEAAGSGEHFNATGLAWLAGLVGSGAYANSFRSA